MPHTEHRKKTLRKSLKAREINRARRSAARTAVKKARDVITASPAAPGTEVREALKAIDKAASHGVYHRNKAARLKSRLAKAANRAKAGK